MRRRPSKPIHSTSSSDPAEAAIALLRAENEQLNSSLQANLAKLAKKDVKLAKKVAEGKEKDEKIRGLQAQIDKLSRMLFGRRSERVHPDQLQLAFLERSQDEQRFDGEEQPDWAAEAPDDEGEERRRRRRKKNPKRNGRGPLPDSLPRDREVVEPGEEERKCSCCGEDKEVIGEETTEQLNYVPGSIRVRVIVRPKYACSSCRTEVSCAAAPEGPIIKGRPASGMLAELIVNKYGDHLPLNRLQAIYERHGLRISKATLCDWIGDSAALLEPVADCIGREVKSGYCVQLDETPIKVRDPCRSPMVKRGRIWVYCGPPGAVRYLYSPTKAGHWPRDFLDDFEGYVQADAAGAFDQIFADGRRLEVGCWAHARRKFFDILSKSHYAGWLLAGLRQLFEVEARAKREGLSAEQRWQLRQEESKPLLDKIFAWMKGLKKTIGRPSDPMLKAMNYSLNQEEALFRFLEDGRLILDNNRPELCLRRVAVGRKNWLFAGSDKGAKRAATLYTIIQSCRELQLDPWIYLQEVLDQIARTPLSQVAALTPMAWRRAQG